MSVASQRLAVIAATCGLVLLAAPAARAFTIENQGATDNGTANRLSPDNKFNAGNQGTYKQGNTTIQFGGRPNLMQQYNDSANRLFDPGSRINDQR